MNQDDIDLAKKMKAAGATWKRIGERFGCCPETVKKAVDPEFAAHRRAQINARRRERKGEPTRAQLNIKRMPEDRVPAEEAHQRLAEIPEDRRDITGRLLGDPLFERSALYAMRGERV